MLQASEMVCRGSIQYGARPRAERGLQPSLHSTGMRRYFFLIFTKARILVKYFTGSINYQS